MGSHDRELASAFDGQAERFERAPVQSDRDALARLVNFADLAHESLILDAGCGPGLVAEAFLEAGHTVFGVDLSSEMVRRATARNERFGLRATFRRASLFDDLKSSTERPPDAAVSRYVLHHVEEPLAFLRRQVEVIRPGGVVVLCDHTTDPDPERAAWHQAIERDRDRTHTRNLTTGAIADLFAEVGLMEVRLVEELFTLDFDEWFDRGTPAASKEDVRARLIAGPQARGFRATELEGGAIRIDCVRATVRGRKPSN